MTDDKLSRVEGKVDELIGVAKGGLNKAVGLEASTEIRDLNERSDLLAYSARDFRRDKQKTKSCWQRIKECFCCSRENL